VRLSGGGEKVFLREIECKGGALVVSSKRVKSYLTAFRSWAARPPGSVGTLPADKQVEKGKHAMIKSTFQFMNEAIKNPKHPFRKTDSQPRKAQKNRYERRKVKEFLHLGDWSQEEMA
jgi:hypothetical protein